MATTAGTTPTLAGQRIFTRILVGVDGSPQALEAARQAALLLEADGQLTLLSAWSPAPPIGGTGTRIPSYLDPEVQEHHSERVLLAAHDAVAASTAAIGMAVRGCAWEELLREIERDDHTLVAVGSSGLGRLRGIVEGSVASEIVHAAPCSVLVARRAGDRLPQRLVVGVDGSPHSEAAYAVALSLAARFDAEVTALAAPGGKGVEALVEASETADLVVVGSRGLHGVRALGSVSERVAHRSASSVLVVRGPAR